MQANYVQRLRILFGKVGPTRYIGHLDLARTLERAFNRAGVPLSYTQGFNRRPRMQLMAPLPLGFTSDCEMVDIWLEETLEPEQARAQISARMAPGVAIHRVWEVPLGEPALQTQTESATYIVTLLDDADLADLAGRVAALLDAPDLPRERRGKTYDLRPQVLALSAGQDDAGKLQLKMTLTLLPGQTGRPDEVAAALGIDPTATRIHRTAIRLVTGDGVAP